MLTGLMQANDPVRSRAHDNATGTIASGLDMWHDAHGASQAARFASHSAWELQHDESIIKEQARQGFTLPLSSLPNPIPPQHPPRLPSWPACPPSSAPLLFLPFILPGSCYVMMASAKSQPGKAQATAPSPSPPIPAPLPPLPSPLSHSAWELQHDKSISKGEARQASATLPCALLCCAVLCRAGPCRAVPCRAVPCRAVPCRAVPCCAVLGWAMLCCAVPCCAVLCCAVLCCATSLKLSVASFMAEALIALTCTPPT